MGRATERVGSRRFAGRFAGRFTALALVAAMVAAAIASGAILAAPRARAANEVHLTAAGDYGARSTTASVLTKLAQLDPDAHLALGDLAYGDTTSESAWCSYVKARVGEGFPFELISGNHESLDEADGLINNYSACLPNQVPGAVGTYGREYFMDFPKGAPLVRVIQVSPNLTFENGIWAYAPGDAHWTWLSNAIDGARAQGAKWIIVSAHHPCLSVGQYGCASGTGFFQLMAQKRVDLVLHGHEHGYMRTHQLRSGVTGCQTITPGAFNAACVADSDSDFAAGAGTVFATVGTGGTPQRAVNPNDTEAGYFASYAGQGANETYGLLDLSISDTRLSAHFVGTSGGTLADAFTITKGTQPPNEPPVAAITKQVQDRTVTVNGSDSSDGDGFVADYAWDFGDGSTATGVAPPPHVYAADGTYTIGLTVRDDQGATNTTTTSVTVTGGTAPVQLAADAFGRTLASGWGNADVGGAWTVSTGSAFAVNGGVGTLSSNGGSGRSAYLRSVSSTTTDLTFTMASNKVVTGSGLYVSALGRFVAGAGDYRAVARFRSDGKVSVRLARLAADGTETPLVPDTLVNGLTYTASERVQMRVQVTGTSPTTVRTKLWKAGTAEPAAWAMTATDATAALQSAGYPGIVTYLSGSATNAPIVLSFDDLLATKP
jgi:PKD repeat protein